MDKAEDSFKAVGYSTDDIAQLKKGTGKIKKIAGKGIKFADNTEIMAGMIKEYADNKIWSTVAKELASDFARNEKGRLVFVWKKPPSEPTTVRGGKGNDKIYGDEKRFYVYEYTAGDGHDTIFNWNSNDTLSITGGSYTGKIVNGDYVVTVGKGSVTFKNYTSRRIRQVLVGDRFEQIPCQIEGQMLSGGSGNDWHEASHSYWQTIESPPEGISVDRDNLTVAENFSGEINTAKDYAQYITRVDTSNAAGNVEIIGSDSVERITAGKGNDNVHSNRSFTVIHSGAGKDIVSSSGDNNSINSGADNDIIVNIGDSVTVDSGIGNDSIISDGKKNLFVVADGGNKIIYGFGKTDTLQIVDDSGTYSKKKKGDDLIITADDGKITLAGAASLKSVHIEVSATSGREIYNDESNAVLLGTNKADTIENGGANVSISALGGNDSIRNSGDHVTINGGKGNYSVGSWAIGTAYVYSAGNDTIDDFNEDDTIVLGSVKINSSIRADGTVTLNLSNKKTLTLQNYWSDKINTVKAVTDVKAINVVRNSDSSVTVKGSSADDYIENSGANVTIDAGAGNDNVYSNGWYVSINGGAGSDTIESRGDYSTLRGGAGNDLINDKFSPKSLFDGGAGNDSINVLGMDVTVTGGKGSDQIFLKSTSNLIKYASGDGNDTIYGFNSTDSLSISGGKYSTQASGSDVIVTVGKEKITLKDVKGNAININKKNVGGNGTNKNLIVLTSGGDTLNNGLDGVTISGGKGNDVLENDFGDKVLIAAGAGNDTIWNIAREEWNSATNLLDTLDNPDYATLDAGDGDDYIFSQDSKQVSINGGNGNDSIRSYANNSTILGGAGNDSIFNVANVWSSEIRNSPDKMTIDAGTGNDYIYNDGKNILFKYASGDGFDSIVGFNETSTLSIAGSKYSTNKSGNDVIVTVDKGKITLQSAANLNSVNIDFDKTLTVTDKNSSPVTVDATTKIIDATARTKAIKITGNGLANVIIGGKGNDSLYGRAGNDSIVGNVGNDKLYGSNGNDTLVGDAGNDTLYGGDGADTFVYKPGEGTDTIFDYSSGDMLKILKSDGKDGGTFTSFSFKSSKLTLAISGGGKVIFSGVSASDSFNINGKSYSISGTKLK